MLGAQLCNRVVLGFGSCYSDHQLQAIHSLPSSIFNCSSIDCISCRCSFSLQSLSFKVAKPTISSKSVRVSCKHSRGRFDSKSSRYDGDDHDYLEASVLITETIKHQHLRKHGFQEVWRSSSQFLPFSARKEIPSSIISSLESSLLRRFRYPTIFLKISCDGDFLLPIVVGEFAVDKLIESSHEDAMMQGCPNQYQFVRNLVAKIGYEVKMVRITDRVANTYYAKVYFSKVGGDESFSVDARPSDAINVARRCKAPIYVNKQIVLNDAIRLSYGARKLHDSKPIYDVALDSALEGPDPLAEEIELVKNLNLALEEERYMDAAIWRDKLIKLRESQPKQ